MTFTVTATGAESYQWQYSKNGGNTWLNSPTGKTATFSFTATTAMNGRQYRCVVTNSAGDTVSNAATLTVIIQQSDPDNNTTEELPFIP